MQVSGSAMLIRFLNSLLQRSWFYHAGPAFQSSMVLPGTRYGSGVGECFQEVTNASHSDRGDMCAFPDVKLCLETRHNLEC